MASLIGDEAFDFLLIIPMPRSKNYFIGDEDNLERQVWPLGAVAGYTLLYVCRNGKWLMPGSQKLKGGGV